MNLDDLWDSPIQSIQASTRLDSSTSKLGFPNLPVPAASMLRTCPSSRGRLAYSAGTCCSVIHLMVGLCKKSNNRRMPWKTGANTVFKLPERRNLLCLPKLWAMGIIHTHLLGPVFCKRLLRATESKCLRKNRCSKLGHKRPNHCCRCGKLRDSYPQRLHKAKNSSRICLL